MPDGRFGVYRGDLPFPVETLRHRYVAPFGGRSEELAEGEVGIHARALAQNTELVPRQDKVLISVLGPNRPRPLYTQTPFEVVALDARRPDALLKSSQGEAVLPRGPSWDIVRRPLLEPARGERLILNGVASRVLGEDPGSLLARVLRDHLSRRTGPPES
ncbi:MAG: hypothetical protein ACE5KQ_06160 [Thermoplasmata archaeon]